MKVSSCSTRCCITIVALMLVLLAREAAADERSAAAACPAAAHAIEQTLAEQARISRVATKPALRLELLAMDHESWSSNDREATQHRHTARMRSIIRTQGFPGPDAVGVDGYKAAWLMVQHSVDPALQAAVLPTVHRWALHYRSLGSYYALLRDRLLVDQGYLQLFGTQLASDAGEGAVLRPLPLAFPDKVAALRAAYGLMLLDDYVCYANEARPM